MTHRFVRRWTGLFGAGLAAFGMALTSALGQTATDGPDVQAPPRAVDITLICPAYREHLAKELVSLIDFYKIRATVNTKLHVQAGKVMKVDYLSGPAEYRLAVEQALAKLRCVSSDSTARFVVGLELRFE